MRIGKIVDTIQNFGAAEHYIQLKADFKKFLSDEYGKKEILAIDPNTVVKKYNLKGIVFGLYVTQEERYHFLYKITNQLEALAKIKKSNNLGKGVLIIAFGVEGMSRPNAHYNPAKQLINLNRGRKGDYKSVLKGENSFIHEYGHFLDFCQGRGDKSINTNFATETEDPTTGNDKTKKYINLINKVEENKDYYKKLDKIGSPGFSKYLKLRIEVFARLFESALTYHIIENKIGKAVFFKDSKYINNPSYLSKKEIKSSGFDKDIITILRASA